MIGIKAIRFDEGEKLYNYIAELRSRGYIGFCMIFDSMDFVILEPSNGLNRDKIFKDVHGLDFKDRFQYMIFEFETPGIYGEESLVHALADIFNVNVRLESEYSDVSNIGIETLKKELKIAIEKENYELCSKLQKRINELKGGES